MNGIWSIKQPWANNMEQDRYVSYRSSSLKQRPWKSVEDVISETAKWIS